MAAAGISSTLDNDARSTREVPLGGVKLKTSEAIAIPAFQSLSRKVYLRSGRHGLACDDVLPWQRALARLDPDLPVCVEIAEGQMIALDPIDDAHADHPAFKNARGQLLESVREQEVGTGNLDGKVTAQPVDQLVEAAPLLNLHLGELPGVAVMHGDRRAVRDDFHVRIASRAAHAELVGSCKGDVAGGTELNLL